jgi:hypothetical protein
LLPSGTGVRTLTAFRRVEYQRSCLKLPRSWISLSHVWSDGSPPCVLEARKDGWMSVRMSYRTPLAKPLHEACRDEGFMRRLIGKLLSEVRKLRVYRFCAKSLLFSKFKISAPFLINTLRKIQNLSIIWFESVPGPSFGFNNSRRSLPWPVPILYRSPVKHSLARPNPLVRLLVDV